MQRYLKGLETWLNKWRLKIAPHKCSFNIYRGSVPNLNELPNRSLTIFSEKIPVDKNPKYHGVTMDKSLNYSFHTNVIKAKCNKLLNILKCLSYKSWALDTEQNHLQGTFKIIKRSTAQESQSRNHESQTGNTRRKILGQMQRFRK
jgi:hypothetical protein